MPLHDYHTKRKFDQTPEPTGGQGSGALRFVVQKHAASRLHYDFRLEMDGVLRSWAIPKGPSLNPHDKHLAMMTEDHPYDYHTFEGNIPGGNYGAGAVMIWDEGTYEPLAWDEKTGQTLDLTREEQDKLARAGIHKGHLTFVLHGTKLNGEFALIKMQHADEENAWLLVKADKDHYATEDDVTQQDRSVITNRTIEEIAADIPETTLKLDLTGTPKAKMPTEFKPMLATLAEKPFDDPNWLYEIKWDGYRIMAEVSPKGVTLHSRGGQDYTSRFRPVADELHHLRVPALIDGEITVVDEEGRASFGALQNYIRTGAGHLVYFAFDLLHLDGHDLADLPLARRKELLRQALPPGNHLKFSDHLTGAGAALLKSVRAQNIEGVIAKRADSTYQPANRSRDWLKLKIHHRQEAVIIGYTEPRAGRQYFGSLVLALYDGHELVYIGHSGSGFTDDTLKDTFERLQPLVRDSSPITPTPQTNEPATWVQPTLVCEVQFSEWTEDGLMRHPIFVGLREDKPAAQVHREKAVAIAGAASPAPETPDKTLKIHGKTVHLTHQDKVYWPEDNIAKGQLIDYYTQVAPLILPYLKDRPESLNRFPHGITGESFYQKDMNGQAPDWAKTITIHSQSENRDLEYLLCQDEATLLYMVNLGCIDFNPWNSRTQALEYPDWCVIDLDPEAVGFDAVIETAIAVHEVLDELKIPSYPKTSGATGIHIYIPTKAQYHYDQIKIFAEIIAQLAHAKLPNLTSLERSPAKRQGKVYLDYLQNRRGQTLAAPYSVRPKPHATVSTPLHWDEIATGLSPELFTITNAPSRFAKVGDLWAPVLRNSFDLTAILKNLDKV